MWAPGSGDALCPRQRLMTRVQQAPRRLRLITWPCDLDLWPWRPWRLWLMRVVVLHPYTKFEVRRPCRSEDVARCVSALMGLVTLTFDLPFDLETGMRVKSKVWNLHSDFGHARPSGSRVIRYVRDGRTDKLDGRTDKSNAYCPLPYGQGHHKLTDDRVSLHAQIAAHLYWLCVWHRARGAWILLFSRTLYVTLGYWYRLTSVCCL